jgi:hypothetical protein
MRALGRIFLFILATVCFPLLQARHPNSVRGFRFVLESLSSLDGHPRARDQQLQAFGTQLRLVTAKRLELGQSAREYSRLKRLIPLGVSNYHERTADLSAALLIDFLKDFSLAERNRFILRFEDPARSTRR